MDKKKEKMKERKQILPLPNICKIKEEKYYTRNIIKTPTTALFNFIQVQYNDSIIWTLHVNSNLDVMDKLKP